MSSSKERKSSSSRRSKGSGESSSSSRAPAATASALSASSLQAATAGATAGAMIGAAAAAQQAATQHVPAFYQQQRANQQATGSPPAVFLPPNALHASPYAPALPLHQQQLHQQLHQQPQQHHQSYSPVLPQSCSSAAGFPSATSIPQSPHSCLQTPATTAPSALSLPYPTAGTTSQPLTLGQIIESAPQLLAYSPPALFFPPPSGGTSAPLVPATLPPASMHHLPNNTAEPRLNATAMPAAAVGLHSSACAPSPAPVAGSCGMADVPAQRVAASIARHGSHEARTICSTGSASTAGNEDVAGVVSSASYADVAGGGSGGSGTSIGLPDAPGSKAGAVSTLPISPMGSAALFADYERGLSQLERLINGGLAQRKAELAAAAAELESNVEEVREATLLRSEEAAREAEAVSEALQTAQATKLGVLHRSLAEVMGQIDAIDGYVARVLSHTSGAAAAAATTSRSAATAFGSAATASGAPQGCGATESDGAAAAAALAFVERQPELLCKGERLLAVPVSPLARERTDDLPDAVGARREAAARLEALEELLPAKDAMLAAALQECEVLEAERAEQASYAERAHAFASALQSKAADELQAHAEALAAATEQLDAHVGALGAARAEADTLRAQNLELRTQNELLRDHCTELRALITRAAPAALSAAVV